MTTRRPTDRHQYCNLTLRRSSLPIKSRQSRSAVLTNAVREALGLTVRGKLIAKPDPPPRYAAWAYGGGGPSGSPDFIVVWLGNLRGQRLEGFFSTLFVIIIGLDTTFNRIAYSTRGHDSHESHPLLLLLA
jgi:hypothetical protein